MPLTRRNTTVTQITFQRFFVRYLRLAGISGTLRGSGSERVEALRIADIFRAHVIDTTHESFIFEVTGAPSKIEQFATLMRPLGLVEISRTGVLSITRGAERM